MAFTSGQFPGFETAIHEPGIAVFTFNQPERMNGLTQAIKRELIEQLTQAQMDDAVRVVVFTGQGRAFSAGDDVTGRPLPPGPQLMPDIFRLRLQKTRLGRGIPGPRASRDAKSSSGRTSCWV